MVDIHEVARFVPFLGLAVGDSKFHSSPLVARVLELCLAGAIAIAVLQTKIDDMKELTRTEIESVKSQVRDIRDDLKQIRKEVSDSSIKRTK